MPDQTPPTAEDGYQVVAALTEYTAMHTRDWVVIQSGLVVGSLLAIAILTPEVNERPQWYAQGTVDKLVEQCRQHDDVCPGC
jgi:hypothetical protein